jgi:hypothetical protein
MVEVFFLAKVATGTGITGDDSTIPALTPASPHPCQSPQSYRGRNEPHPRQWRVPVTRRGLHGDDNGGRITLVTAT